MLERSKLTCSNGIHTRTFPSHLIHTSDQNSPDRGQSRKIRLSTITHKKITELIPKQFDHLPGKMPEKSQKLLPVLVLDFGDISGLQNTSNFCLHWYHYTQKDYQINSKTISVREFLRPNYRILFPKEFGQGFGNPVLTLLTGPKQFQKQFGSAISEQELPKLILK